MDLKAARYNLSNVSPKFHDLFGGTDALPDGIAIIPARTRLHRGNQQAMRWESHGFVALWVDDSCLDDLSQHLQVLRRKGSQLFKQEYAMMGQCDFAGELAP